MVQIFLSIYFNLKFNLINSSCFVRASIISLLFLKVILDNFILISFLVLSFYSVGVSIIYFCLFYSVKKLLDFTSFFIVSENCFFFFIVRKNYTTPLTHISYIFYECLPTVLFNQNISIIYGGYLLSIIFLLFHVSY